MTQSITARKSVITYGCQLRGKPQFLQAANVLESTRADSLYTVKTQLSNLCTIEGTSTNSLQMRKVDCLKTFTTTECIIADSLKA